MGGAIAQLVAVDYPERVASLTLVASDSGNPGRPAVADPEAVSSVPTPLASEDREAHADYRVEVSKALAGSRYPVEDVVRSDAAMRSIERFFDPEAAARQ